MMKTICTLCLLFLSAAGLLGQDYHFSQPYAAPLYLNPALAGAFNGSGRVALKYRNQWNTVVGAQAYNTFMAALDGRAFDGRNWFGYGGFTYYDFAGDSQFRTLHLGGSGAYHFSLSRTRYLAAGFQVGGIQYEIGNPELTFDRQFDGRNFNTSLDNRENIQQLRSPWMLDLSPGLVFYDTEQEYTIGASVFHVTEPRYSFLEEEPVDAARLSPRWVAHAFVPFMKSNGLSLAGRGLYMKQRQSWQALLGLASYLGMRKRGLLFGSAMVRGGNNFQAGKNLTLDAIILSARLERGGWSFGLSYDINISPLRAASRSVGALEFSLVHIWQGEERGQPCPEFY